MSRTKKQAKSELNQIVKAIDNRMSDFEAAVQELRDLKDTLNEVDDEIIARAAANSKKIDELNQSYQDNKIRAVNQAVKEMDKVIISREELADIRAQLENIKNASSETIKMQVIDYKASLDEKMTQALEVQKLQHECETAQLKAQGEAHKKEVANLKETLERMSEELTSQKKLTSDLACANRPQQQNNSQ